MGAGATHNRPGLSLTAIRSQTGLSVLPGGGDVISDQRLLPRRRYRPWVRRYYHDSKRAPKGSNESGLVGVKGGTLRFMLRRAVV